MPDEIPTPFRSAVMTVDPAWIDPNGHLNMAYYSVLFDRSVDGLFETIGLSFAGMAERGTSVFILEAHVSYLREIHAGDPVVVDTQLVDFDHKRMHFFQTMYQTHGGFIAAHMEQLAISIDLSTRKSAPFRLDAYERIKAIAKAHAALPRPERVGRGIGIRR